MTGMSTNEKVLMRYIRTRRIVDSIRVLAFEVLREYRMDRAARSVARISMEMICLRMHMEKRHHEHPEGRPHEDQ